MALGNGELLQFRVATQLDDLEPISKRRRQRLERVGRAHEHHLGQVERELQVVIGEALVLLGVEHLQQRGLRRAGPAGEQLVDLVQEQHGVLRSDLAKRVHDAPR